MKNVILSAKEKLIEIEPKKQALFYSKKFKKLKA